mgnify:CR=1 FL=1
MQGKVSIVDANVLLRYLLRDDERLYRKAEGFFREVFAGRRFAYLLQAVVAEVVYVFAKVYRVPREEISEILLELLSRRGVRVQDKEVTLEALRLYGRKNLDFVDCLICAYGKSAEVFSFDKGITGCLKKG